MDDDIEIYGKEKLGKATNNFYRVFWPILMVVGVIILIVGYLVPVTTFDIKGLAGWVLKDEASNSYSLFELGNL